MSILDLFQGLLTLAVPSTTRGAKRSTERAQNVAAVGFWVVLLLAVAVGLWAYFGR
ncbi:MAG TPA: hypothetical protein VEU30_08980 [Thermoanaerobaculia bacterium]|nr:hypothetical protein [Thermoanaerobaculia bacterium]